MTGTLEVIAGAYITKDILKRLLGPSADYLGGELKNAVEAAHKNISEIIKKALRKSGDNLKEDGSVPPRVVGEIAFKGSFIEDDLMREYFGGLLAASRTSQGDDERAVPMLKLVEQMSIFQLRFHYLCYWFVNHLFQDADVNIGEKSARHTLQIFIPFKAAAIALKVNKRKDWNDIVSHSIMGLEQHQLIDADATKAGRSDVFPTSYG